MGTFLSCSALRCSAALQRSAAVVLALQRFGAALYRFTAAVLRYSARKPMHCSAALPREVQRCRARNEGGNIEISCFQVIYDLETGQTGQTKEGWFSDLLIVRCSARPLINALQRAGHPKNSKRFSTAAHPKTLRFSAAVRAHP
jgi:hypothetical protein